MLQHVNFYGTGSLISPFSISIATWDYAKILASLFLP